MRILLSSFSLRREREARRGRPAAGRRVSPRPCACVCVCADCRRRRPVASLAAGVAGGDIGRTHTHTYTRVYLSVGAASSV